MQPTRLEKKPSEMLIALEEVPTSVVTSNPFEIGNGVVLQGNISAVRNGEIFFRTERFKAESENTPKVQGSIKENLAQYTSRDLERSPNNPFLLNNLGLAYLGSGEVEKAYAAFSRALSIKPDLLIAAMNLASVHTMRNEDDQARVILENLLKENREDTRVLLSLGNTLLREKRVVDAKNTFKKLLANDKKNVPARNSLAIIELIQGNLRAAVSELRKCLINDGDLGAVYNNLGVAYWAIGSYTKAIEAFKISLRTAPFFAGAALNLAKLVREQTGVKEAIEVLESSPASSNNRAIKELLAKFYIESRALPKAIRILSSLLSESDKPDLPKTEAARLMNNLGVVYGLNQEWAIAEKHFVASAERAGSVNKTPIMNLIDMYFNLGILQNADKWITILRSRFPQDRMHLFYEGVYAYRRHDVSDAIRLLEEFVSDRNKYVHAYTLLSFIYSEDMCDFTSAINLLKDSFGTFPNELIILNNLAYNYLMKDDLESAQILLAKSGADTENLFLTATKGLLEIKLGNLEMGRQLYNSAASMAPNDKLREQVLQKKELELAKFYINRGDVSEAKLHLEKVVRVKVEENVYSNQARDLSKKLA